MSKRFALRCKAKAAKALEPLPRERARAKNANAGPHTTPIETFSSNTPYATESADSSAT